MPSSPNSLVVRTLANGATAQLRSIIDEAEPDEARRIYSELLRIAKILQDKHEFVPGGTHKKTQKLAVLG